MKRLILGLFVLVMSLLLSLLFSQEAFASFIYWTANYGGADGMRIQRTGDGTGVTDLFKPIFANGIGLDMTAGKMYWADHKYYHYNPNNGRILRANMDGTDAEYLFTEIDGVAHSYGIALDTAAGDVYWTSPNGGKVQRGNMDGTGDVEDLIAEVGSPCGIALDTAASKMYWTDTYTGKIRRAKMDGTAVEDLFTFATGNMPTGIALDTAASKMYWLDGRAQKIFRGNMDGTGDPEVLFPGIADPGYCETVAIALDTAAGKMYWADRNEILRGNMDGTGEVETIVSGLGGFSGYGAIRGIALQIDGTPLIPHHGSSPEPIPEPTTIVLMGFGLLGVLGVVIRQRRKEK